MMKYLAGAVLCGALAGCGGDPITWKQVVQEKNGNATIDMDGVTIVFDGSRYNGLSIGSVDIAEGFSLNPLTSRSGGGYGSGLGADALSNMFDDGQLTISFKGRTIVVSDSGRTVSVDGQQFTLPETPKQTIIIGCNGRATMREYVPADSPSGDLEPPTAQLAKPMPAPVPR